MEINQEKRKEKEKIEINETKTCFLEKINKINLEYNRQIP